MTARIVQLTDLHLTARADGRVFGSDVWRHLDRALAHAAQLVPAADWLVLTGDLANRGEAEAYKRLSDRLQPWRDRLLVVPGNHDHRERLRAAFPGQWSAAAPRLAFAAAAAGCRLIGLDSLCQGRTRGQLDGWQLSWLHGQLAGHGDPWVLFLHHPPVRVRCWWLDKDLLRDRAALQAILAARPPRAIFTGHVHQEHDGTFAGVALATSPAVAYQYGPRSWLPLPSARAPALRVVDIAGERVTSRVERP